MAPGRSPTRLPQAPTRQGLLRVRQPLAFCSLTTFKLLSLLRFIPWASWPISSLPRIYQNQCYVNNAVKLDGTQLKANKKGGVSPSVAKLGGWRKCFQTARFVAGWDPILKEVLGTAFKFVLAIEGALISSNDSL